MGVDRRILSLVAMVIESCDGRGVRSQGHPPAATGRVLAMPRRLLREGLPWRCLTEHTDEARGSTLRLQVGTRVGLLARVDALLVAMLRGGPQIHKRGRPHGPGLGRRRWPVERSNAWVPENKRVARRYDRLCFIVQSLLQTARTLLVAASGILKTNSSELNHGQMCGGDMKMRCPHYAYSNVCRRFHNHCSIGHSAHVEPLTKPSKQSKSLLFRRVKRISGGLAVDLSF